MNLTNNQKIAIEDHEKPMIVSASAGSGKTFAMVQRAISILKQGKATINELLIVTFTNNSAIEMKQRLYDALKNDDDEKLNMQLQDFAQADISSIDSFCQKILKRYFYEINLSPNFKIIDEMESTYFKNLALTQLFQKLQKAKNKDFIKIVEVLTKKRQLQVLSEQILKVSEFANSLNDKQNYYKNLALNCYSTDFKNNQSFQYLIKWVDKYILNAINELNLLLIDAKDDEVIFIDILNRLTGVLNDYLKLEWNEKVVGFENLSSALKIPSKNSFKIQSQKDFQGRIKNILDSLKKILVDYKDIFQGGNINALKADLLKAEEYAKSFINIVVLFEKEYENIKQEKFLLDFSDLERKTLEILKNKDIKNNIAKKYKYVFIDEFQDTNDLQFGVLSQLCMYATPFYVGDPKQSIYGFRNSSPEILINLLQDYKNNNEKKMAVNFIENFRSDKVILDFCNFIFSIIMTKDFVDIDYKLDGKFDTTKSIEYDSFGIPKVSIGVVDLSNKEKVEEEDKKEVYSVFKAQQTIEETKTTTDYTDLVASYIKSFFDKKVKIYDKNLQEYRGVKYSDFAILLRNRASYVKLVDKLQSVGYPLSVNLTLNLLDELEVKILHNFLKTLSNYFDDIALSNFLLSPIAKLTESDLSEIRLNYMDEDYFYNACIKYKVDKDNELSKKLDNIFSMLDKYKIKVDVLSISQILYDIINECDLELLWLSQPNGNDRMGKVRLYINILQGKSINDSLYEYLNFTKVYSDAFKVNYSTVSSDDCIKIMTIHNSKGLEFPITILGDCGKLFQKTKTETILENANFGVAIDMYNIEERLQRKTFLKDAIKKYKIESELQEEMRLLYVACTRAKNYLGIFGDYKLLDKDSEKIFNLYNITSYFDWILYCLNSKVSFLTNELQEFLPNMTFQVFELESKQDLKIDNKIEIYEKLEDKHFDKALAHNFNFQYEYNDAIKINIKNSVSKLLEGENLEKDLIKEKDLFLNDQAFINTMEEASKRGTAYHKAMEFLDFDENNFDNQFENLKSNLNIEMMDYIVCEDIKNAFQTMKGIIPVNARVHKEQKFMMYVPYNEIIKNSKVRDKVLIQGVIDIFIEKDNEILLIDYKTNMTKNIEKLKEKYSLQLQLYKKACQYYYNKPVQSFIYSFSLNKLIEIE